MITSVAIGRFSSRHSALGAFSDAVALSVQFAEELEQHVQVQVQVQTTGLMVASAAVATIS